MKLLSYVAPRARPDKLSSLQEIRIDLLNSLLVGMAVFGSLLYGLALIPVLKNKMYDFPVLYSGLYAWLLLITFVKRIPFRLRAASVLFLLYSLGVINLYVSGFNLHVAVFLMGCVVLTALFFGLRSGLAVFLFSSATIAIMGLYIITGRRTLPLDLPQLDPMLWGIGVVTFILMTISLIVTLTELVHGLESNLIQSQGLGEELRQSNETLAESEARYRTLVEMSPDLVVLLDLDGNILMANKSSLERFKYESLQDVTGKNMTIFISPEHRQPALETFQETLKTGQVRDVRCLVRRRDETHFWVEASCSLIVDAAQEPEAILVVGKDITEQKKMEQSLRAHRDDLASKVLDRGLELQRATERLKELVDRSPAIIYAANLEENFPATYYSENVLEQLGYSPGEFTGDPVFWKTHVHPQDLGYVLDETSTLLERGELILEYRFRHKNGEYRWMRDMVRLIYSADGQPLEMVGSWIDITDRKQAEDELRAAKTLLEKTFASLDQAVFVVSARDRTVLACNPAVERIFGYDVDEMVGRTTEFMYMDRSAYQDYPRRLNSELDAHGIHRAELQLRRKDGNLFPADVTETEILDENGQRSAVVSVIRDITARKLTEEKLHASQLLYESLVNVLPHNLFRVDLEGRYTFVNKTLQNNLHAPLEDILGKTAYDFYPEELARKYRQEDQQVLQSGVMLALNDVKVSPVTGETFYVDVMKIPVYDAKGDIYEIQGILSNVTERMRVYEALAESEERYRILAEAAQDMIYIVDREGVIKYINQIGARRFGRKPEQVIGKSYKTLFPSAETVDLDRALRIVFESGESQYVENKINICGQTGYLSTWLAPIKGSDLEVSAVMGVSRDISPLKLAEQSLEAANELLEMRVSERTAQLLDSQRQLRGLAQRIATVQEDERRRISRELHDQAGQVLVGLRYSLDMILKETPPTLRKWRRQIKEQMQRVDQAVEQVRSLAYSLRPPILDLMGLDMGLKNLCQEFSKQTGLKVDYTGVGLTGLSEELTICLYRIVQEALTNILKHAGAHKVDVALEYVEDQIILSIKDDGRGAKQGSLVKGLGIQGMEERIRSVGGSLEIQFTLRKGSHLKAVVPWNRDQSLMKEGQVHL